MGPTIIFLLSFAIALRPGYCESKISGDDERAKLPEFLTEIDLTDLEASDEDIEALKTVVKRLAPEKNGEYQVYQVFFGNEELLNEWLKGAGVIGQPGVDFPALTSIPATSFSCKGMKHGYYADLETNCQVFHICDNGKKNSFLCPNGTIFQQSQSICDWWFKVDCSKSAEHYEQSAERLAEDERKRAEAKRMNSEFHRSSSENDDSGDQNYYKSQNSNYDGRQNGRTNPYGQTVTKNQIPGSSAQRGSDFRAGNRGYDPNQIYSSNGAASTQYNQINNLAAGNPPRPSQDNNANGNYKNRQQQSSGRTSVDRGNHRPIDRQQNQIVDTTNEEAKRQYNYDQRGGNKFSGSNQNSYSNQEQTGRVYQQSADYTSSSRNNAGRDKEARNFGKSSNTNGGGSSSISSFDYEPSPNRVTPSYTETTTFRTSTPSPIREFQQLAESAAFATSRGNRFNEAYSSSQFNSYYNTHNADGNRNGNTKNNNNNNNNNSNTGKSRTQQKKTETPRQKSINTTPASDKTTGNFLRLRVGQPAAALPFPTFQPIYKPRTTTLLSDYETTTLGSTIPDATPTTPSYTTYNTQYNRDRNSYTDNFEYGTTTAYPTNRVSQTTTQPPTTEIFTEDYLRNSVTPGSEQTFATNTDFFENTTPTIITSGTYVNAKAYTKNKVQAANYKTSDGTSGFTTARSYSRTQDYRQNSAATNDPLSGSTVRRSDSSYIPTTPNYREVNDNQFNRNDNNNQLRASTKNSTKSSYRQSQNLISTSTEKTSRSLSTLSQNGFTVKTLSPYDTSFTYQQGKVMSTLGPYVPFTKNYAYSTTSSTIKPPAYTTSIPSYTSPQPVSYSSTTKNLGGAKARVSSVTGRPTGRLPSGSAAYLPEKKSDVSMNLEKKNSLNGRPLNEREHAMSMLESLRGLEGTAPSIFGSNSARDGLTSGPSTLHSLALYFATASDDFDVTAESRTDSDALTESAESREIENAKIIKEDVSIELPKSILTQHTINSYAELFNLNNALEVNSSSDAIAEVAQDISNEDSDDLDIEQSQGPIDGARKSNSTKLRELAQVFTHALSAYLQDPDTFKKILTEIRPTEPSANLDDERYTATTFATTTVEDYPSVTKEKDEVLDFSDDTTPPRARRPTTIYPITTTDLPTTTENYNQREYYTTSGDYYTTSGGNSDESNQPHNDFAFEVNHAFGASSNGGNELNPSGTGNGVFYPDEASGPSDTTDPAHGDPLNDYTDNYFPSGESNKIGGFQNNSRDPSTYEPYGKYVKPFDATPINDNYVSSSTPATYAQPYLPNVSKHNKNSKQRYNGITEDLNPPTADFSQHANSVNNLGQTRESYARNHKGQQPTTEPFRIRYYDTTTSEPRPGNSHESLVTAGSVYSKYHENSNDFVGSDEDTNRFVTDVVTSKSVEPVTRQTYVTGGQYNTVASNLDETTTISNSWNNNAKNDRKLGDHWTSSPTVTQLWESTIFVDPKRINQGLVSGTTRESQEYSTVSYNEPTENPISQDNNNQESLVTDATSSGLSSRNTNNLDYSSSRWKWSNNFGTENNDDSPTVFSLLPETGYPTTETNFATATPSPIYTTRSSITTTITSSVTSTTDDSGYPLHQEVPRDHQSPEVRSKLRISSSDRDMTKAQEMFGKLNTTSTNTLMRVMKQADSNATVRQLVLLLISHCKGPMNKTMEEQKEQLLDALLRMPVNEFTSEESRDIVAGINRINVSDGDKGLVAETKVSTTTTTTTTEEPAITTFRSSKKGRRFKNNAAENSRSNSSKKTDDIVTAETSNALPSSEDTSASDARALELLRSLYTIAAKWG